MSMFKQVADIRTADTLKLDVPDCDYQVVQVEATPFQQELVQELADRADSSLFRLHGLLQNLCLPVQDSDCTRM